MINWTAVRWLTSVTAFGLTYATPRHIEAQEMSARAAVSCFELQREAYPRDVDVPCGEGVVPAPGVLLQAASYPPEFVDEVLDELVRLALETDSDVVRRDAVQWVAFLGRTDTGRSARHSGIVSRLTYVYDQAAAELPASSGRIARRLAIHMAGKQAESRAAASFLERIARGPFEDDSAGSMAILAIKTLHDMGPAGAGSLDRLRQERAARQGENDSL